MKNKLTKSLKVLFVIIISNLLGAEILSFFSSLNFNDALFMTSMLTILGGMMLLIDEPPHYKELSRTNYYEYKNLI